MFHRWFGITWKGPTLIANTVARIAGTADNFNTATVSFLSTSSVPWTIFSKSTRLFDLSLVWILSNLSKEKKEVKKKYFEIWEFRNEQTKQKGRFAPQSTKPYLFSQSSTKPLHSKQEIASFCEWKQKKLRWIYLFCFVYLL